jgi:hypothetical protein
VKPFFSFYGGKHRLAPLYGKPKYDHVIEPFAGSAGFSTCWEPAKVTLVEFDPVIVGIWRYLQGASAHDIERLPSLVTHVDDLPPWVCQEARWLIGFCLDHNLSRPGQSLCNWGRTIPRKRRYFWGEDIKQRIINQLERIRHWTIIEGSYEDAPDIEAHWHIDPPYNNDAGRKYRFYPADYDALAQWCVSRKGFVQVCEADGAPWLPSLRPVAVLPSHRPTGCSFECVYERDNRGRF